MTAYHKIAISLAISLAVLLAFAGYGWLGEHDARLKAEGQTALQQRDVEALKTAQKQAAAAAAAQVAAVERQKLRPATATDVVRDAYLPPLPAAIRVEAAPADPSLPDAPAARQVVVPEADFTAVRDAELACQETGDKLAGCEGEKASLAKQATLLAAERDEWERAAKGGSRWHRAIAAAKQVGLGAAIGAAAGYGLGHRK